MAEYQDELLANYDELRQSRDWDWATMAKSVNNNDPALAAVMRERAAAEAPTPAPKGRSAAPKSES